jgi:hypothetical protein
MRIDSLQQFVKLRRQLTEEKSSIEAQLREINKALGEAPLPSLSAIEGAGQSAPTAKSGKRTMSPEARARIAAAQRARWAASRKGQAKTPTAKTAPNRPGKRRISAAARKAIADAARKRWAAAKAAGKSRL